MVDSLLPAPADKDAIFKVQDAQSYHTLAGQFERLTELYTVPIAQRVVDLAQLNHGSTVLDVGCGTGVVSRIAAGRVGASGRVTGIDLSDGMLDKARELAASVGLSDRIRYAHGDAESLPFPEASFDAVVSLYALRHFPNPQGALQQMFRCQAPGGRTVVAIGSIPPLLSFASARAVFRIASDSIAAVVGRRPLYATGFLDKLLQEHLGPAANEEDAAWTHSGGRLSNEVRTMMQRAGYRCVHALWVGQSSMIRTGEDFWNLQVTLSSRARKRIQSASDVQVQCLRRSFDDICARHLKRGGRLIYRSGALMTVGLRPA